MRRVVVVIFGVVALAGGFAGGFVDLGPAGPALAAEVAGVSVESPVETVTQRFEFAGRPHLLAVPADVDRLSVVACGAGDGGTVARRGTQVEAVIAVTPRSIVSVFVGGAGDGAASGWNSGRMSPWAGATGGATDVRVDGDRLRHRDVVAPGGGGAGGAPHGDIVTPDVCAGHGWAEITYRTAQPVTIRPHGVHVRAEGDEGRRVWRIPVVLTRPSPHTVSAVWQTRSAIGQGNASPGRDYLAADGTIEWPAGETLAHVEVEVVGDEIDEVPAYGGEWGVVVFDDLVNAELDTETFFGAGLFVIADDD